MNLQRFVLRGCQDSTHTPVDNSNMFLFGARDSVEGAVVVYWTVHHSILIKHIATYSSGVIQVFFYLASIVSCLELTRGKN